MDSSPVDTIIHFDGNMFNDSPVDIQLIQSDVRRLIELGYNRSIVRSMLLNACERYNADIPKFIPILNELYHDQDCTHEYRPDEGSWGLWDHDRKTINLLITNHYKPFTMYKTYEDYYEHFRENDGNEPRKMFSDTLIAIQRSGVHAVSQLATKVGIRPQYQPSSIIQVIENDDEDALVEDFPPIELKRLPDLFLTPSMMMILEGYRISQLDYAAYVGSIKCFLRLLSQNNERIYHITLLCALIGGNSEIIRICYTTCLEQHQEHDREWGHETPFIMDEPYFIDILVRRMNKSSLHFLFDHNLLDDIRIYDICDTCIWNNHYSLLLELKPKIFEALGEEKFKRIIMETKVCELLCGYDICNMQTEINTLLDVIYTRFGCDVNAEDEDGHTLLYLIINKYQHNHYLVNELCGLYHAHI